MTPSPGPSGLQPRRHNDGGDIQLSNFFPDTLPLSDDGESNSLSPTPPMPGTTKTKKKQKQKFRYVIPNPQQESNQMLHRQEAAAQRGGQRSRHSSGADGLDPRQMRGLFPTHHHGPLVPGDYPHPSVHPHYSLDRQPYQLPGGIYQPTPLMATGHHFSLEPQARPPPFVDPPVGYQYPPPRMMGGLMEGYHGPLCGGAPAKVVRKPPQCRLVNKY